MIRFPVKTILFRFRWIDMIKELKPEEAYALMLDIFNLMNTGEIPVYETQEMQVVWNIIYADIKRDLERHQSNMLNIQNRRKGA